MNAHHRPAERRMAGEDLLTRSIRHAGRRYAKGEISREAMIRHEARVALLRQRRHWLTHVRQRREDDAKSRKLIDHARAWIAEGRTIIAYDTEYLQEGPVNQCGLAVWKDSVVTTTTYTVPDFDRFEIVPSLFGSDVILDRDAIQALAQSRYDEDALHIFHTARAEHVKLGLGPVRGNAIDIARLGHRFFRRASIPGLRDLCGRYAIPVRGHHNAGNDARYTLDVFLNIVADPYWDTPAFYARRWSDEYAGILKLWPTRRPAPDAATLAELRIAIKHRHNEERAALARHIKARQTPAKV